MSKSLVAAFALSALTALPAAARQSLSDCETVWKLAVESIASSMIVTSPGKISVGADNCVVRDLQMESEGDFGMKFRVNSVSFGGTGLERLAQNLPPTALFLQVDDLQMSPKTGDAGYEYLLRMQQGRDNTLDLVLRAHWDEGAKTLLLDQVDIDFPQDNSVKVSATVLGIDLSTQDTILMTAGQMVLTKLDAEIVSNGLFEQYLLMPFGSTVLYGIENPEALVEAKRNVVLEGLPQMPEAVLPASSRDALARLVTDLPNPTGKITLRMTADPGIGAGLFSRVAMSGLPKNAADVASYLDGATFEIGYTPAPAD